MKILAALLIVGLLYGLPVYLFDAMVMPELSGLQNIYTNVEQIGTQVAADAK